MGTVRKVANKWGAEVCIKGKRSSKCFDRKTEASAWVTMMESEIFQKSTTSPHTLRDAIRRYPEEESPLKKGARWEAVRLSAFETPPHRTLTLDKRLDHINPDDLAIWRDARLKVVAPGTVLREINLLNGVLETSRRSWR